MQKAITVKPIESQMTRTNGLPGFFITFTGDNARIAQQVCGDITSMFLSENLRAREESAQGTNDFLVSQLNEAKRSLEEQDARLAQFQRKYIGALPEQESSNLNMLISLNTQLDAVTQNLSRLQQEKTYLEALLGQQSNAIDTLDKGGASPQVAEAELQKLEAQAAELETRYTPDHPDVVKIHRQIEAQRKKLAASTQSGEPKKAVQSNPPEFQKLQAQLSSLDEGILAKKREQERIQQQMNVYQARIAASPAVQEQYKQVTRDYQTALQFYNELLSKRNRSEMAIDLERRQQGEQFLVMDPPNLPEQPVFPNRRLFGMGGLAGGLIFGLLLSGYLEYRDQGLRNERDVLALTNLPTLASIPWVAPEERSDGFLAKFTQRRHRARANQALGVRG